MKKNYRFFLLNIFLLIVALLIPKNSQAQIRPEPPSIPQPLPEQESPPLKIPTSPTPEPTPEPTPDSSFPDNFIVKEFKIIGNTAFSSAELQKVVAPYLNRPISLAELLQSASQISQLYFKNGYITSGAIIPTPETEDGIITIQVIEGFLKEINITGLNRLNTGYVRARVAKAGQTPFNIERLSQALQLLQLDPLIENINAQLAAGATAGESILNIQVSEANAFNLQLELDNQRSPLVGTFRRKFNLEHLNLLGFGDRFTVGYVNTDGSNSLDNLSYTIPINASNGTISLRHSRTSSNLINLDPVFADLEIATDSSDYDITYRQPLYQTSNREFSLGLNGSLSLARSLGDLEGESIPISIEANERGEINISAVRFSQEYVERDRRQVFAAISELNLGVNLFDATIDNNEQLDLADSRFLSWRGQAQYLLLLNSRSPFTTLLVRGNLQLADDLLLPREQFALGGPLSVRGYRQDSLFGDNGLFLSAEIRQPLFTISQWDLNLQIAPFIDYGKIWNDRNSEQTLRRNDLSGVGIGLLLNIGDNFDARLDWGIPLNSFDLEKDNLQENGIYFQIQYRPL